VRVLDGFISNLSVENEAGHSPLLCVCSFIFPFNNIGQWLLIGFARLKPGRHANRSIVTPIKELMDKRHT